ncbi:MAG TPA: phosphotriesterase [Blastocatellia bacterium]|nr:phosphotriesterase [Blastocatellia bacterium]
MSEAHQPDMNMPRRRFLATTMPALAGAALARNRTGAGPSVEAPAAPKLSVMTVRGRVNADQLGATLMHEHVMVDFIGADKVSRDRYEPEQVFATALPHLKRAADLGCRTFVDCTPAWLGRDVSVLHRLSVATGLHIVTNTGYYGARKHAFIPAHAYKESAAQLAGRWTREFERGIDGAKVKPGIIKIGVDAGPLSEINAKLVAAAALTSLRTGLTIGSHTGDGVAAMQQLDILEKQGVSPKAFIWIHAQSEKNKELHVQAAKRGCWVEFDGVNTGSVQRHLELVKSLAGAGFLDRMLISMDAGWYHIGEPEGGNYRGYESLFTEFLPALRKEFSEAQVNQLIVGNPQEALALRVRKGS